MSFVVEDGTGKSDATSYVSVTVFRNYWTDRGTTFTEIDATIQGWLVLATEYIDLYYEFWGEVTDEDTQALQWPRDGLRDSKKAEIANNVIPQELKDAVCRLAIECKDGTTNLEDKLENGLQSKRIGPVSKTFKNGYKSDYKNVTKLLRVFIRNNSALGVLS